MRWGGRQPVVADGGNPPDPGYIHEDYWFSGVDANITAHTRPGNWLCHAGVGAGDNLRFKPFASYAISKYDDSTGWNQLAEVGAQGPVTENLSVLGFVGYHVFGDTHHEGVLGGAQMKHDWSPYTSDFLEYREAVTTPVRGLTKTWEYDLKQILGPHLLAELYGDKVTFDDENNTDTSNKEWAGGVRLSHDWGAQTTLRLTGQYGRITYVDPSIGDESVWQAIAQVNYWSYQFQCLYQNTSRQADVENNTYRENLVYVKLTKYF